MRTYGCELVVFGLMVSSAEKSGKARESPDVPQASGTGETPPPLWAERMLEGIEKIIALQSQAQKDPVVAPVSQPLPPPPDVSVLPQQGIAPQQPRVVAASFVPPVPMHG